MSEVVGKRIQGLHKRGTLLLTEQPFAYILAGKLHDKRCAYCFASSELRKCSGCSYAHYCDRDCQKKGWYFHKEECANIKRLEPQVIPDAVRMLARLIIKLQKGGAHERSFYTHSKFRVFKDLMSHYNEIKNDIKKMEHFMCLHEALQAYLGADNLPNSAELLGIYGRMVINSFSIFDDSGHTIGTGLYLAASVVDHSCNPNAVTVFDGTTLYIRTLEDMENINWPNIYISYIDNLDLPSKRQKELERVYYFLCQCQKCKDVEELKAMTSVICQNKGCDGILSLEPMNMLQTCTKCNNGLSDEKLKEIEEVISFTEEQLESMKDVAYLDICRMCLRKQQGLLYYTNIYNVKVLQTAMDSCILMKNWEGALEYGTMAKEVWRKYSGNYNPYYGIAVLKLGKIAQYINRLEDSQKFLKEAADILLVTHGEKHPLVKNELLELLKYNEAYMNA
ncbi:UNVERIFIED_CONTAM: hypothetical protein PYX00_003885 [Menopon gallinae]|uniref:MYND-type domain-containing protein n=1 Tax=Menopon gallinae TaxID=328185 RepID=A0AAW2I2A9_9NEOP